MNNHPKIKPHLETLFNEVPLVTTNALKKIETDGINKYNIRVFPSQLEILILYHYLHSDLQKVKELSREYGLVKSIIYDLSKMEISPGISADLTYSILSDDKYLIKKASEWQFKNYQDHRQKGTPKMIFQNLLINNDSEASTLLDNFSKNFPGYTYKEIDRAIFDGILNKNHDELKLNLYRLLEPKNHNRRNADWAVRKEIFSFPAVGFLKLAWIRGIELEIDHPLIPMELMPIQQLESYNAHFSFLRNFNF